MKLHRNGTNWNRDERNKTNDNWDKIEGNYNNVVENVSDKAFDKVVDSAKLNWKEPVDTLDNLPSDTVEGETRMVRDTGKVYRYNGTAWQEIQEIDATAINEVDSRLSSQLAETADGLFNSRVGGTVKIDQVRPAITIIDDDTRNELYTKLFPYLKKKKIVINAAVISDRINNEENEMYERTISIDEFLEMKNSGLIEYCNHTSTHRHLAELTEEQIHQEIRDCEKFLESHGIFTKHLVYPFGSTNQTVKEIASRYINSASKANGLIVDPKNEVPDTFNLNRVVFEEEITTIKDRINQAKNNNGWLIINTHSQYDTFNIEKLDEIIDYATLEGLDIITVSEGYRRFGNVAELRSGSFLRGGISALGYREGIFKPIDALKYIESDNLKQDDKPSVYENRTITTTNISTAEANNGGWELGAGVLFTDRRGSDDYTYQIYHPINSISSEFYKRRWINNGGYWEKFRIVGDINRYSHIYTPQSTIVPANGTKGYTVNDPQFRLGDSLVVNPDKPISSSVFFTGMITSDGVAQIRLFNFSNDNKDLTGINWILKNLKN